MTLKVRLTSMMVLLLVAVTALQYLLAERERRSMEERLSRLSAEVASSTREVLERTRAYRWTGFDSLSDHSTLESRVLVMESIESGADSGSTTAQRQPGMHAAGTSGRGRAAEIAAMVCDTMGNDTRFTARVMVTHRTVGTEVVREGTIENGWFFEADSVVTDGKPVFTRRVEREVPEDSVQVFVDRLLGHAKGDSGKAFVFALNTGGTLRVPPRGLPATDVIVNLPLPVGGLDSLYALEMRFPTDDLLAELERSRKRGLAWLTAMIGVGVIGAALMANQFTRPLRDLRASFGRVERGDLAVSVRPERHDEIGQLTESFNEMVARLRESGEMKERLAEAERMAAIGRMAAGVAHEVRNPLNAILLTLEQIREKSRHDGLDRYHEIVSSEVMRLERLVTTFLDLARASDIAREPHDAAEGLRAAVELFRPEAERNRVTLRADVPGPYLLSGDRFRLPNVWNNLLSNALAAVSTGGTISLETEVKMSVALDGAATRQLQVTVRDDGPGIAPELLPRIWEPFVSGRKDGTGLGLSIVRSVVEAHGGAVEADSSNLGTVMRVLLPLA